MGLFRKKQKDNPTALEMKSLAEKAVEHGKRFNYDFDYKRESIEELEEVLDKYEPATKKIYATDEEISEITFSGGEPFLNPILIEMIKYVSERTNWEVSCASNLSLVTKERIQQLANIPLKFNIQFPFIDASKFQKSTGSGNLSRVMENIRLVRESGLEVGLNSVIQSDSKEDVKEMVEFALKEELPLKLLKMSLHLSSSSCVYTLQHRTLVIFRRNQYVLQYPGTLRFLFLP